MRKIDQFDGLSSGILSVGECAKPEQVLLHIARQEIDTNRWKIVLVPALTTIGDEAPGLPGARRLFPLLAIVAGLLVAPVASAGIPDAKLSDSGAKTIWPGCLGGSSRFTDRVKYHDGGLFLGGDAIEWWSSRSIGPQWNCPVLPSWVWHHATITHHLKWTSIQMSAPLVKVTYKGPSVSVKPKNGLLQATWTDYVTNTDWVFGPKKTWASQLKLRAIYGGAIRMRAEHRATVTFYGPKGETMKIELEAHKEQWG